MAGPRDGQLQLGENFQELRGRGDLGFDPGRCEQKIQNNPLGVFAGREKPDRRQTSCRLLLDSREDAIPSPLKPSDERLGLSVTSYSNRQIRIAGETRLTPDDDRQPADDGPLLSLTVELALDSTQDRFEGGHRDGRGQSTGRPTQSPCSAPGRSWSHCAKRAAISCSSASGKRRRRFCRIIPTPASKRSRAVRKRRAATVESMTSFYSPMDS